MPNEKTRKTDYRSRYTQLIIKQALLKILSEKQLNKVSVTELCAAANINRGTFYNHFEDVYDVSYSIEQDFYEQLTQKLASETSYNFDKKFFCGIISLLNDNMDLVKILLADMSNSSFIKQIIGHIHKRFSALYASSHPHISPKLINNILTYSINGSIGIITQWVNDSSLYTIDELADLIEHFNNVIVTEFINKS